MEKAEKKNVREVIDGDPTAMYYSVDVKGLFGKKGVEDNYLGFAVELSNRGEMVDAGFGEAETECFIQTLSHKLCKGFEEHQTLPTQDAVEYKDCGDVCFLLDRVEKMLTYGGFFVIAVYEYNSVVS